MTETYKTPTRILHVIGGMSRGGPETWLMHILRHIDRQRFQMDFVVHTTEKCSYDQEVQALGGRIIPCCKPHNPFIYARDFKRILQEHGPYDVVHSHVQYFSGFVLRLAYQAGVPVRVAHNHTPSYHLIDAVSQKKQGLWRRCYIFLMRRWIKRYTTVGLVVNKNGGPDMFGTDWQTDPRWRIHYCAIDLAPFRAVVDPQAVRRDLGIPPGAFVVGNVSRFFKKKNHPFMLEIVRVLAQQEPKVHLLLVGDGPELLDIKRKVAIEGLTDLVTFAGSRSDVPNLLLGAMDVFLFPSDWGEGLPLVLMEAQAARLPSVISSYITQEADVIDHLIRRVPLSRPPSAWAEEVLAARNSLLGLTQPEALKIMEQSPFNILRSMQMLHDIYLKELAQGPRFLMAV
jgi:glycosyltransferase involved in cell wall biosynthesis